jgi:hypothetical protein
MHSRVCAWLVAGRASALRAQLADVRVEPRHVDGA